MNRQLIYISSRSEEEISFDIRKGQIWILNDLNGIYDIINSFNDLTQLVVILDYQSYNIARDRTQREIVHKIILSYPEITFFFDEHPIENTKGKTFLQQLLGDRRPEIVMNGQILEHLHQFRLSDKDKDPFQLIESGFNNYFDGTNLRAIVRNQFYEDRAFHYNFKQKQTFRQTHSTICIDCEQQQSLDNSYACYVAGYRSIPISTFALLDIIMNDKLIDSNYYVREFDLQFSDADDKNIDKIRGCKYDTDNKKWIVTDSLNYWGNKKTIFLTNNYDALSFQPLKIEQNYFSLPIPESKEFVVSGFPKPVTGIYNWTNKVFNDLQYGFFVDNKRPDLSRVGRRHFHALDMYDIGTNMLNRSIKYYREGRFVFSALLATEAIELLNCFYSQLTLQLFYWKAKAENAIAVSILGGNEKDLVNDCILRIKTTKNDIKTLLIPYKDNDKSNNKATNVLNQIFSDCRNYCKEKEHFESEDVFLEAMAELNEGVSLKNPIKRKNKDDKKNNNDENGLLKQHIDRISYFIEKVNSYGTE